MTTMQRPLEKTRLDLLWQAVQQRDPTYDGFVIYAVRTTGIYCRPICPSRRPHRANVRFFADSKEARSAGYRACLRCFPDRTWPENRNSSLVKRVCDQIDSHLDQHPDSLPSLAQLSQAVEVSASHLQRVFKKETGLTPRQYAHSDRLERFKSLVRDGSPISAAMFDSGFSSSSRLYEDSDGQFGMTPGRYRRGGAGTTIGYLVAESPLGSLLVAATGKGICSVKLGDDASTLLKNLRAEFPAANLQEGDETLRGWLESVLEYLVGERLGLDLPLDIQATAFQRRVWRMLQSIPYGETRSYQQMALNVGLTGNASRAVGNACASNPVALVIPCHRAVRKDGSFGGYRWGLHRKKALLAMEERKSSEDPNWAASPVDYLI